MKLSKSSLVKIIKEELQSVLSEKAATGEEKKELTEMAQGILDKQAEYDKLKASIQETLDKMEAASEALSNRKKTLFEVMKKYDVSVVKIGKWAANLVNQDKYTKPTPSYAEIIKKLRAYLVKIDEAFGKVIDDMIQADKDTKLAMKEDKLLFTTEGVGDKIKMWWNSIKQLAATLKDFTSLANNLPKID